MMLRAALEAAGTGWCVLPCIETPGERSKAPRTPHGFKDATQDPETIRRWWTRWPGALIGAVVPEVAVVLDIDPRHGGSLEALVDTLGPLPRTLTCWSGRGDGGAHLYFRVGIGRRLTQTRLPQGIDVRAGGKSYCILPPSLHPATGQPYRWDGPRTPAWLPPRALEVIEAPVPDPAPVRPLRGDGGPLVRFVAESVEGTRNARLFWAACRAAEAGQLDTIGDDLAAAARSVGLTDAAIRRTLTSARRSA